MMISVLFLFDGILGAEREERGGGCDGMLDVPEKWPLRYLGIWWVCGRAGRLNAQTGKAVSSSTFFDG